MSQPDQAQFKRWLPGFIAFFTFIVILAGCGRNNQQAGTDDELAEERYQMGTPLEDSTYTLIVESEYGNDTLKTEEFYGRIQSFAMRVGRPLDAGQLRQVRQGIADEFIRRHLLQGEAKNLGLKADDADVEKQLDVIIAQNRLGGREELEKIVAEQGMTMDSIRSLIKGELAMQMVQDKMIEDVAKPTDAELEDFRETQAEEVRAQHILFTVPDPSKEDSVFEAANVVLDSIRAGADFAEMARRHSEGPTSVKGGDLGYFNRKSMVEPFADAAFALSDSGDVSSLVKTQFGYHIIRLTGRRTAALMDTTQARAMLMQERQRDAVEDAYRALRKKAVIHVNPEILDADLNMAGAG